jgi:hypothetical protein
MPNNKKAWHIRQLAGKRPDNYCKYAFAYEFRINVFKNLNMGMDMREFSSGIDILNILKDCRKICGDSPQSAVIFDRSAQDLQPF